MTDISPYVHKARNLLNNRSHKIADLYYEAVEPLKNDPERAFLFARTLKLDEDEINDLLFEVVKLVRKGVKND